MGGANYIQDRIAVRIQMKEKEGLEMSHLTVENYALICNLTPLTSTFLLHASGEQDSWILWKNEPETSRSATRHVTGTMAS